MNAFRSFLLFITLLICSPSYSQIGGGAVYEFINLPISARVTSLGGNLLSTKDNDLSVALVNPALLTDTMNNHMAMSYINHFVDVNYGYVALAKNIRKDENYSIGIQYLNYGEFIRADEIGNKMGTFSANEMSLNLSYARPILDSNLTFGATIKTIYSALDSYNSFGSSVDLGVIYAKPLKNFAAAFVMKNIGYQWKPYVKGERESLPFEMQIGFSKKPKHAPFRFSFVYENIEQWDLTYNNPNSPTNKIDPATGGTIEKGSFKTFGDKLMRHFVFGGEFILSKNFFIRAGYNYQRRQELKIEEKRGMTGFSFGFGFKVYKFHVSYGRAVYSLAGASNNFSIIFDLNSFHQKAK